MTMRPSDGSHEQAAAGERERSSERLGSRFGDADESPGFLLWRVTNRWQSVIRTALAPHDLTHVQFVLLAALSWSGGTHGLIQSELGHKVHADPMMVSQVVRILEGKKLVVRARDVTDARAIRVTMTPAGTIVARNATKDVEAADASFFSDTDSPKSITQHLVELAQRGDPLRS